MDLLSSKEIKIHSNIENKIYINFNKLKLSRVIDNTISKILTTLLAKFYTKSVENIIIVKLYCDFFNIRNFSKSLIYKTYKIFSICFNLFIFMIYKNIIKEVI